MGSILADGKELYCPIDVKRPWPLLPSHGKRRKTDFITVHWSVTKNAKATYDVLVRRVLGAHFLIDDDGTVIQTGDISGIQYTTAGINSRSIGIETSNPYYLKYQNSARPRPIWKLGIRGSQEEHLGYTQAELSSLVTLCSWLCDKLGIPPSIPMDRTKDAPLARAMTAQELVKFKGVIGHYHVTERKIDPGLQIWDAFLDDRFMLSSV